MSQLRKPATTSENRAPTRNGAVFIDMENLFGGYQGQVSGVPIRRVMEETRRISTQLNVLSEFAVLRAYANWADGRLSVYKRELMEIGIEPVQVFGFGQQVKNAADIELVVDAMELAATQPQIDVYVIVSSDGGFVPLVRKLHSMGKFVLVVTTSAPNKLLRSAADHCLVLRGEADRATPPPKTAASKVDTKDLTPIFTAIRKVVSAEPTLVSDGAIDSSILGKRLRSTIPDFELKGTGHRTLTSLATAALKGVDKAPFDIGGDLPNSRAEFRSRLESTLASDHFRRFFAQTSDRDETLNVSRLLAAITQSNPAFVPSLKTLFPATKMALQYGLSGTSFRLAFKESDELVLVSRELPGKSQPVPDLLEDELSSLSITLELLRRSDPPIRIASPELMGDAIEMGFELVEEPMVFSALVETLADEFDEWGADDVRLSATTLCDVGIFTVEAVEGLDVADRLVHRSEDFLDVEACLAEIERLISHVLQKYSWPACAALSEGLTTTY